MDYLKTIFGDKALKFDEFTAALGASKDIKLANLAGGQYVDKSKFDALKAQLDAANGKIGELSQSVKALEGADETVVFTKQFYKNKYPSGLCAIAFRAV